MQEPAPKGIVQPANQPDQDLHQGLGKPLEQLGHQTSTVPPQEQSVVAPEITKLTERTNETIRDITHLANATFNPDETNKIRIIPNKKPIEIAWEKIKSKLKKAA